MITKVRDIHSFVDDYIVILVRAKLEFSSEFWTFGLFTRLSCLITVEVEVKHRLTINMHVKQRSKQANDNNSKPKKRREEMNTQ